MSHLGWNWGRHYGRRRRRVGRKERRGRAARQQIRKKEEGRGLRMLSGRTWPPRAAMSRLTRREGGSSMSDPAQCPTRGEQRRGCSVTTNRVIRTKGSVVRLQSRYECNRNGLGLTRTTTDHNGQRLERGSIQSEQDFAAIVGLRVCRRPLVR